MGLPYIYAYIGVVPEGSMGRQSVLAVPWSVREWFHRHLNSHDVLQTEELFWSNPLTSCGGVCQDACVGSKRS